MFFLPFWHCWDADAHVWAFFRRHHVESQAGQEQSFAWLQGCMLHIRLPFEGTGYIVGMPWSDVFLRLPCVRMQGRKDLGGYMVLWTCNDKLFPAFHLAKEIVNRVIMQVCRDAWSRILIGSAITHDGGHVGAVDG